MQYSGLVTFTDGTNTTFSTRERPHMIFSDKARSTPVGVFTAVSNQPIAPSCDGYANCNINANFPPDFSIENAERMENCP